MSRMLYRADELRRFYRGKRVLVTGHMGFKGSWLSLWLTDMGAEVYGFGLAAASTPCLFEEAGVAGRLAGHQVGDVRSYESLRQFVASTRPEIIFHLAAQPLVIAAYRIPRDTYEVNVMGTVNVLEAVREPGHTRVVQIVTSDKCYAIDDRCDGYREEDRLGGRDPYSSSKACAELVVEAYRESFFNSPSSKCSIASTRAGNVIGGGDWSADRLVPDCIVALQAGATIELRNPEASRPWQHVLEPCAGYLLLAMRQWHEPQAFSDAFNFGPGASEHWSVARVVDQIIKLWGAGQWRQSNQTQAPAETRLLALDSTRATSAIGWRPVYSCEKALAETIDWYRACSQGGAGFDAAGKCLEQIYAYEAARDAMPAEQTQ